jgi:threonine dehydrogenase-like Zn-dependent dehydrogenase
MRAVTVTGPDRVAVQHVAEPQIEADDDAIVRPFLTGICGTDLHALAHPGPAIPTGTVLGHEFCGEVVAVGAGTRSLSPGDTVVASDFVACGRCWFCRRGAHWHCPSRRFFGHGSRFGPPLAGAQAELVRVPFADTTLGTLPATVDPLAAVFVTDNLATGYEAVRRAMSPGDIVAVVGGGPVGLLAGMSGVALGAAVVVVVEPLEPRRRLAEDIGLLSAEPSDARSVIDELTDGRGADVVVDAVGGDTPLDLAISLVRPAGSVMSVGLPAGSTYRLPVERAFIDELGLQFVVGDAIRRRDELLVLLASGAIDPLPLVSEVVPLDAAAAAYDRLIARDAVKVVLAP